MRYISRNLPVSRFFTILGMIFTGVIGTFLHFLFQWTANHPAIALFSPVNESIWEHLKLLFFPVLLFTSLECILYKRRVSGFLWARTMALLAGLGFIIAGFYIYSGILGTNYTAADIGLFVISILITFLLTPYLQKRQKSFASPTGLAIFILLLLTALFFLFTFYPPHIGLFMDPAAKDYGILRQPGAYESLLYDLF